MYGKVIDLEKPIAVLKRNNETCSRDFYEEPSDTDKNESTGSSEHHTVQALVHKKIIFKTRPKPIIANVPKRI